jgi:hypothetical protein
MGVTVDQVGAVVSFVLITLKQKLKARPQLSVASQVSVTLPLQFPSKVVVELGSLKFH